LVTDSCNGPSTKSLLARSLLYRAARDLGNVQAAERGPTAYGKRRRLLG
jgi:hypothetical protein